MDCINFSVQIYLLISHRITLQRHRIYFETRKLRTFGISISFTKVGRAVAGPMDIGHSKENNILTAVYCAVVIDAEKLFNQTKTSSRASDYVCCSRAATVLFKIRAHWESKGRYKSFTAVQCLYREQRCVHYSWSRTLTGK